MTDPTLPSWYSEDGADAKFIDNDELVTDLGPYAKTSALSVYAKTADLATVATSGSYDDLTDQPTIPSALPDQSGNAGKYLTTDGSSTSWGTVSGGTSSVSSDDITDATTVGKSVLTATDAATARSAIGAGTSNLAIGTTSSTALAGNTVYVPPTRTVNSKALSADVTLAASDVSALPTTIGSTATSSVVVVANGATAPAGLPDGTVIVELSA